MERSKKFGLQLRVQPTQKNPTKPPVPSVKPLLFNDDDEDNVEREILRQAHKKKSHKDVSSPALDKTVWLLVLDVCLL